MASRARLIAVVSVAIAVVGFVLAVPVVPFQRAQSTCCAGTQGIRCFLSCPRPVPPATGLQSVSGLLFGFGGRVVDGTYNFG
jgi:hypothetical protein